VVLDGYAGSWFIAGSSPRINMIGMSEDRDARTEEQNTPRSWQPTSKQVFWVIGVGLALEALAMLVVNFYPDGHMGDLIETMGCGAHRHRRSPNGAHRPARHRRCVVRMDRVR
jgi:hypothetical protein